MNIKKTSYYEQMTQFTNHNMHSPTVSWRFKIAVVVTARVLNSLNAESRVTAFASFNKVVATK